MNCRLFVILFVLVTFFVSHLEAQDTVYLDAKGAVKQSEEKSVVRIKTKKVDNNFLIYKSSRDEQKWGRFKLSSTIEKKSDSTFYVFRKGLSKKDYTVREVIDTLGFGFKIRECDSKGDVIFVSDVMSVCPLLFHGLCTLYDVDGLPMSNIIYANNKKIRETILFNVVDDSKKKITKEPTFPGGRKGFSIFVAKNIRFPISEIEKKKRSYVYIKFMITKDGKMEQFKAARHNANKALVKEFVRVVSLIDTPWQPAEIDGEKVSVWYYARTSFVGFGTVNAR